MGFTMIDIRLRGANFGRVVMLGCIFLTVLRLVVVCDVKCLMMNRNTCFESRMNKAGYVFGACISARTRAWASP